LPGCAVENDTLTWYICNKELRIFAFSRFFGLDLNTDATNVFSSQE